MSFLLSHVDQNRTIRVIGSKIDEIPESVDGTIDYFRISVQIGLLKGYRDVKVDWNASADYSGDEDSHVHLSTEEKASKLKLRSSRQPATFNSNTSISSTSQIQRTSTAQRSTNLRSTRATSTTEHSGSNVNLGKFIDICNMNNTTLNQLSS